MLETIKLFFTLALKFHLHKFLWSTNGFNHIKISQNSSCNRHWTAYLRVITHYKGNPWSISITCHNTNSTWKATDGLVSCRMSPLLQFASCFLAFLSRVEGASKSIEKLLVDLVQLKTEKQMCKESLPPHTHSFFTSQFSSLVTCSLLLALPDYKGQKSTRWAIRAMYNHLINTVLGWAPGCPPLPPRGVLPACQGLWLPWYRTPPASSRQNLTQTIKTTEIFRDPCGLHFFSSFQKLLVCRSHSSCLWDT